MLTSEALRVTAPVRVLKAVTVPVILKAAASHADPSHTNNWLLVVFQYNAPVSKGLLSLSTVGADDLAPKYLSSKESKEAAALASEVAALDSESAALVSDVAALASLIAAAFLESKAELAELAALVSDVAALDSESDALVSELAALASEVEAARADVAAFDSEVAAASFDLLS